MSFGFMASGLGKLQKIEKKTLTENAISVTFSNLTNERYFLIMNIDTTAATPISFYLYVNGDTTKTNYYVQQLHAVNGTISGARYNNSKCGQLNADENSYSFVVLQKDAEGQLRANVEGQNKNTSNVILTNYRITSAANIDDITSITIACDALTPIKAGSVFELYRIG